MIKSSLILICCCLGGLLAVDQKLASHNSGSIGLEECTSIGNECNNLPPEQKSPAGNLKYEMFSSGESDLKEPQLKQVLFIHRHGDRTPINFFEHDPLKNKSFWTFHGLGQLTNRGVKRLHLLGEMIRGRYDEFLRHSVNKNMRISRASGSLRCIESAQTFLSSFLSLNTSGSDDAKMLEWDSKDSDPLAGLWQPASVRSVPPAFDGMLAESSTCKALDREYEQMDADPKIKEIFSEYEHEKSRLKALIGIKMEHFYEWFWASSLLEVEKSYFPKDVNQELVASYKRIEDAGNKAMGVFYSTLKSRRLRAGLLLSDMIEHMKAIRDPTNITSKSINLRKFVHYAAHDLNIAALLAIFELWPSFPYRPDYASNIAIEVYKNGPEWFLKFLYMQRVPGPVIELLIPGCYTADRFHCSLERFEELIKPYVIHSWKDWMDECGNSIADIDPYVISN